MDCMALSKWIRWLYFHGLGGSATMEYSIGGICMFLDTSMYLCCQIYLYEFRYNHSTFVDLLDCCRDKEKGLVT